MADLIIYIGLIITLLLLVYKGILPIIILLIFGILILKYKNQIATNIKDNIKSPYLIFGSIILFFIIYIAIILWNIWPIDNNTLSQAGTFGDSFGLLTSLFSALAFGALLVTLWQQQEDLDLTRQEMKQQQFENMLFKMLEIHSTIVADLDIMSNQSKNNSKAKHVIHTGRDCFRYFRNELNNELSRHTNNDIEKAYQAFWESNRVNLSHYLRYLYNMFKVIDNSNNTDYDKKKYSNIVRAQLSDYELVIIFYNCVTSNGQNFTQLAINYELFDNLPISLLLDLSHKNLIVKKAFGEEH